MSDVNGNIVITAAAVKKTIMINGLAVNDNTVDVNITNTLAKSGVVIVAAYKADGSLVGFATADLTDSTVSIGIDTANASTVSAFIWDSTSTMAPLCDKYTAVI